MDYDGENAAMDPMGPELLFGPIIGLVCTFACTAWVWNSMKHNDKSSFRMICIGEGICTAFAIVGAIPTVLALLYLALLNYYFNGLANEGGGGARRSARSAADDEAFGALAIMNTLVIITLLLQIF